MTSKLKSCDSLCERETIEGNAVVVLQEAFNQLGMQAKVLCTFTELGDTDWDIGAFAEVATPDNPDHDACYRFAIDVQTSNVYVSVDSECHSFGMIDMRSVLPVHLVSAFRKIFSQKSK